MQPKTEVQFAIGVTDIVKTYISHPDHGLTPDEIPVMIKNIMKAFQDASHVSGEAVTAAITTTVEEPSHQTTEETTTVVVEETAAAPAAAPVAEATAKAPSKSRKSREAAPPAAAVAAPAQAVVAEVVAAAPVVEKPHAAPKKKAPVDPLEAKFGGKFPRTTWNNMDPEAAIKNDEIICLIDGLGRKMLHRHLKARHNMTPEEYRAWFHLREDYPMTAPGYSKEKSDYAKVVGLGTTAFTEKTAQVQAKATPKTSRRSRKTQGQGAGARQRTTA
jgi:predicted transcriptional regulator